MTTSVLTHSVLNNVALSHSQSFAASSVSASPVSSPVFTTNSGVLPNESKVFTNIQWSGDTIQNGEIWIGDPPGGGNQIFTTPNNGGFVAPLYPNPFYPNSNVYPPITLYPQVPDLDSLEEGVHDIKGGKIIIKKIKVTEEQLDHALDEELGRQATDEEKAQLHEELSEIAASEEREV